MLDKEKILRGIAEAKRLGFLMKPDLHSLQMGCGCAVTLAAIGLGLMSEDEAEEDRDAYLTASVRLGLTNLERMHLTNAFDDFKYENTEAGLFGRELQKMIDL